ncbi:MAG: hypothetical protein JW803_02375 [Endomicrobiales bacterium]|nr:hypothetical protein [Endomicrobiales bacterium]
MRTTSIKVFHSYEEADQDYEKEILEMTPEERLRALETIRYRYFLLKGIKHTGKVERVLEIGKVADD